MPFLRLRIIVLMLGLLLLSITALAQDPPSPQTTEEATPLLTNQTRATPEPEETETERRGRVEMVVEEVAAEADATTNILLVTLRGMNMNGCDLPPEVKTELIGNALFVDFEAAEGSPVDIQCVMGQIPFTIEVSVPVNQIDLRGKDEMYVITDSYLAYIPITTIETAVGSIPVVTFGEPEQYFRVDVNIMMARFEKANPIDVDVIGTTDESAGNDAVNGETNGDTAVEASESDYVIAYVGTVDGCEAPVLARVVEPEDDATTDVEVEVFRPLPMGILCPRNIVQVEGKVPAPDGLVGIVSVLVNDFVFNADPEVQTRIHRPLDGGAQQMDNLARNALPIEQIHVLVTGSDPVLVRLQLTGTIGDGCPLELESDVNVEGDLITVLVYRLIDPAMMCPMVMSDYDEIIEIGELPAGVYTLNINGTTVEIDLSGQ